MTWLQLGLDLQHDGPSFVYGGNDSGNDNETDNNTETVRNDDTHNIIFEDTISDTVISTLIHHCHSNANSSQATNNTQSEPNVKHLGNEIRLSQTVVKHGQAKSRHVIGSEKQDACPG